MKPLGEFLRRTGRRSGRHGRRGTCRSCRSRSGQQPMEGAAPEAKPAGARTLGPAADYADALLGRDVVEQQRPGEAYEGDAAAFKAGDRPGQPPEQPPQEAGAGTAAAVPPAKKRPRKRRRSGGALKRQGAPAEPHPAAHAPKREKQQPPDVSYLRPTSLGFIRMRGKTDNGRRWYQEVEPELAYVLVREGAAVVVNRHTIRRLYSNKEFRQMILTRDSYTCRFCGNYGDTIDHELPRAKGGHTTPVNCYCACYECNQRKASRDVEEFMQAELSLQAERESQGVEPGHAEPNDDQVGLQSRANQESSGLDLDQGEKLEQHDS